MSCSADRLISSLPFWATEILPLSSETIIASESVFSVIPAAALCLIPKLDGKLSFSIVGRTHLAALMVSPVIMTAPSCKGLFLKKILCKKMLDVLALIISPVSI